MNNKPTISVILPAFNASQTIGECIESVLEQDFNDLELIVVDDGSTDATGEVVGKFTQIDERVRYIAKDNGGVSSARNEGLCCARGEFVAFLDSDDLLLPGCLSSLIRACTPDTSLVIGSYLTFRRIAGLRAFNKRCIRQERIIFKGGKSEELGLVDPLFSTPWAKLYRLTYIKNSSLFFPNISYSEDHHFNLRYLLATDGEVRVLSECVYAYALGGLASSLKFHPDKAEMALSMLDCYENECRGARRFVADDSFFDTVPFSLLDGTLFHYCVSLSGADAARQSIRAIELFNTAWFHDDALDCDAYLESWKKRNMKNLLIKRSFRFVRRAYKKLVS